MFALRGGAGCAAQLDWSAISAFTDAELEARLYVKAGDAEVRPLPDPAALDIELRKTGVPLRLLHHEYLEKNPTGAYGYTQFCEHYKAWKQTQQLTMRQVHRAGDKLFVDYSGKKPSIVDVETGERVEVELFVAVLGASNYTYAEVTRTQTVADWVMSHVRALEYFGGAPAAIVPDQLKSGVTRSDRYEPGIQRTYDELAQHYDTVIFPARPVHPKDKAKVEVGVQVAQRWILARLPASPAPTSSVLDDWALSPLTAEQRNDIFEIIEDRYGGRSTIFASQLDANCYHQYLGDPTVADAVCDRLIHNAHRVVLSGPLAGRRSLRSSRTSQRRFAPIAMTELGDRHAPVSVIAMGEIRSCTSHCSSPSTAFAALTWCCSAMSEKLMLLLYRGPC